MPLAAAREITRAGRGPAAEVEFDGFRTHYYKVGMCPCASMLSISSNSTSHCHPSSVDDAPIELGVFVRYFRAPGNRIHPPNQRATAWCRPGRSDVTAMVGARGVRAPISIGVLERLKNAHGRDALPVDAHADPLPMTSVFH